MARPRTCSCGHCRKCKDRLRKKRQWDAMTPAERRAKVAKRDPVKAYASRRRARRKHEHEHPEKVEARRQVRLALRAGTLTREPCEKCGSPASHAHHKDYSRPLEVTWLCQPCHKAEHRSLPTGA